MTNLTPTQFALVQRVYLESLDVPREERESFVREQLGAEPSLLGAFRALPDPTEIPTAFLEPGVMGINAASKFKDDDSKWRDPLKVGPDIGRFHLLSLLGEGGFGMVYEAEQTEPVRRRVALKIIKPGMDSRAVINRFEAERQALALMDHPCIAKVLDGGTTGADSGHPGLPFFAMELVRGDPITKFCDRERLTIEQRLQLMAQVCDAVQHAHLKGIIHRDIKPSNVLVAFQDGKPCPKIIDFGIAKAIGHGLSENTLFTQRGQLIGTPAYMSPEQAEMSGVDIDTRTDVYSLGVLLYEVLTSTPPFDPESLRSAGYAEMVRIIREVEPPRPSTRLGTSTKIGTLAVDAAKIARARRVELSSLTKQLRTDLDWVVMRCLEKERDHRYMTAGEVAAELRRILAHEPVNAGPPSRLYRSRKFVRRHRQSVAWAGSLVLVAGTLGTLNIVQYVRSEAPRRELDRQGMIAVERAIEAVAFTNSSGEGSAVADGLLRDLLSAFVANVELSQGSAAKGYERVTQNARKLIAQPTPVSIAMREQLVQALLVHAEVLGSLRTPGPGMHDLARQSYQRAIQVAETTTANERSTSMLISLAQAQSGLGDMLRASDSAQSEQAYSRANDVLSTIPVAELANKPDLLRWRSRVARDLGVVLMRQCRLAEASAIIDQDVAARRMLLLATPRGTEDELRARRDLSVGLLTRADLLALRGDPLAGVAEAEQALDMRELSLAELLASTFEKKTEWVPTFERDVAVARLLLAPLLTQAGDPQSARAQLEASYRWLNQARNAAPGDVRATLTALEAELQLAEVAVEFGDAGEALEAGQRAESTLGDLLNLSPGHDRGSELSAKVACVMGRALMVSGRKREGASEMTAAIARAEQLLVDDPQRAEFARLLVSVLQHHASSVLRAAASSEVSPDDLLLARTSAKRALNVLADWEGRGGLCRVPSDTRSRLDEIMIQTRE